MTERKHDKDCGLSGEPREPDNDSAVVRAVQDNQRLLERLVGQVAGLRDQLGSTETGCVGPSESLDLRTGASPDEDDSEDRIWRLKSQFAEDRAGLEAQIVELKIEVSELRTQNDELSTGAASENRRAANPDAAKTEGMSWEQRKNLVIQQLEDENLDAESFASSMTDRECNRNETPKSFVESLHNELASCNDEISELRRQLAEKSDGRNDLSKAQASEIAKLIDADELVQRERHRLQYRQAEWEEKFREEEIQASLERAKLSRERQELAHRQAEVQEELARLRRESPESLEDGSNKSSRRWLVKLGLHEDE